MLVTSYEDVPMPSLHAVPVLLSVLVGLLLGLVGWGFWRARGHEANDDLMGRRDDVLLGLLVLAAFALGVFLAYTLLNLNL
jgi:hypothetical protein